MATITEIYDAEMLATKVSAGYIRASRLLANALDAEDAMRGRPNDPFLTKVVAERMGDIRKIATEFGFVPPADTDAAWTFCSEDMRIKLNELRANADKIRNS